MEMNASNVAAGDSAAPPNTRRRWPLLADFAAVALIVVAAGVISGTLVHIRSDSDTRKAAEADAGFAAGKAAQQFKTSSDSLDAITIPIAGNPAYGQVFALGTCTVAYGPIGIFDTGHIDIIRADGSVTVSYTHLTLPTICSV